MEWNPRIPVNSVKKSMENIVRKKIDKTSCEISDELVKEDLERIKSCYQCGTCTGGCPSGRRTALRTRSVIRKSLLGIAEVLEGNDIWLCSTCYTCYSRCPRNVPVTDIIIKLRNLAVQKGHILKDHRALSHLLIKTGHGVPLGGADSNWAKLRESYNLSAVPPTVHSSQKDLDEVKTLVKDLKFDKLVDFKEDAPKPEEKKEAPKAEEKKK